MTFDNLYHHVIPMDDFILKWRFTDEKYDKLPVQHLEQLKPLSSEASKFLSDFISKTNLHADIPFKKDFFRTLDKTKIFKGNKREIKKWLYQRGLPFAKDVFLSWSKDNGMIVPWKLLIKYFDSFYSGGDDLTVFDQSLQWTVLFFHEDEIYFGTNKEFEPSNEIAEIEFLW